MDRVYKKMNMEECLREAFNKNAIISSDGLSADQFIYVSNDIAYYEDNGRLGRFGEAYNLLDSMEWTHGHEWYVLGYMTDDDVRAIKEMRTRPRAYDSDWVIQQLGEILGVDIKNINIYGWGYIYK